MYNYNKLKGLIKEHCKTQENFAKAMKLGTTTLNSRLNSITFFDQIEIERAAKILKLNEEDINVVFFTHELR